MRQWADAAAGDTFWTQRRTGAAGPVESVVPIGSPGPAGHQWNFVGVEVVRPVSAPPATTAPIVSRVSTASFGPTARVVSWITDTGATSQVDYGPTAAYGLSTALDSTPVLAHVQGFAGLTPGVTYHYRVRSTNRAGTSTSPDATFTAS